MPPTAAAIGRLAPPGAVGQLAHDELALDLEADDEKEERHQPVVDPVVQRQGEVRSPSETPSRRCKRAS